MDLSPEEVAVIDNLRLDKAAKAAWKVRTATLLNVAAAFYAWMQETGSGVTYSTFCDDFGYEAPEGVDRPSLFRQVQSLLETAKEITR